MSIRISLFLVTFLAALASCKTTSSRDSRRDSSVNCVTLDSSSKCTAEYGKCYWDDNSYQCRPGTRSDARNCYSHGNASVCRTNGCLWRNNECLEQDSGGSSQCSNFSESECRSTLNSSRCRWDVTYCSDLAGSGINCEQYTRLDQCDDYPSQCYWDQSSQRCYSGNVNCQINTTAADCSRYTTQCQWSNNQCIALPGAQQTGFCAQYNNNQTSCTQFSSQCRWEAPYCRDQFTSGTGVRCSTLTPQQCNLPANGCMLNPRNNRCVHAYVTQCSKSNSAADCSRDTVQCSWDGARCRNIDPVPCDLFRSIFACLGFPNDCRIGSILPFSCVNR